MTTVSSYLFPEEDLLSGVSSGQGFFLPRAEATMKANRYTIKRKLGRGAYSSAYLVFDEQEKCWAAIKVLTVAATEANRRGVLNEFTALELVTKNSLSGFNVILRDSFMQRGVHGAHLCFVTAVWSTNAHIFRGTAPQKRLPNHVAVQILSGAKLALQEIHAVGLIHGDVKADNIWIGQAVPRFIEKYLEEEPLRTAGTITLNQEEYPIMLSQPIPCVYKWDDSPFSIERLAGTLSDLGSAIFDDRPKPATDIGAYALRAPENVIRAMEFCGKPLDMWAFGCTTYELLTGKWLFSPVEGDGYSRDEHHIALMLEFTGESFSHSLVEGSEKKGEYFDSQGNFIKQGKIPVPTKKLEELLMEHTSLTPVHLKKAASFIRACLRLNPEDRIPSDDYLHEFFEYASRGCADPENPHQHDHSHLSNEQMMDRLRELHSSSSGFSYEDPHPFMS